MQLSEMHRTGRVNDTHREKLQNQINKTIYKSRVLAAFDYYLHNKLKSHNTIELQLLSFIIQLRGYIFKKGDSSN